MNDRYIVYDENYFGQKSSILQEMYPWAFAQNTSDCVDEFQAIGTVVSSLSVLCLFCVSFLVFSPEIQSMIA